MRIVTDPWKFALLSLFGGRCLPRASFAISHACQRSASCENGHKLLDLASELGALWRREAPLLACAAWTFLSGFSYATSSERSCPYGRYGGALWHPAGLLVSTWIVFFYYFGMKTYLYGFGRWCKSPPVGASAFHSSYWRFCAGERDSWPMACMVHLWLGFN